MKLDVFSFDDFIKINKVQEVTSPFVLGADGNPDPDGIFSYEIFGRAGSPERATRLGFINLKRKFIHPFVYNAMYQMYRNLPSIISGERWVKLDSEGAIVKTTQDDPDAETGIDFFIDNWKKINWNSIDSKSREKKLDIFDTLPIDLVFIDKWLVPAASIRDINLHDNSSKGKIDMDESNSMYIRMINYAASESITFTSAFVTQSAMQNLLVEIHNFFTKKPSGKRGIIHSAVMGKTVDYALVSVISAPRFNSNNPETQQIPYGYMGIPLYQVCALFLPLVVKNLEDIFHDVSQSTQIVLSGKNVDVDERVSYNVDSKSLGELVKTYVKDKTKTIRTAEFTLSGEEEGRFKAFEEQLGRKFTVTDLLYRAAADAIYNKHVVSTRFPITDAGSTVIAKIKILTTERTIDLSNGAPPDTFDGEYMSTYPHFLTNSKGEIESSKILWIDTVVPNNSYLAALGADFDGDTMRLAGLFTNDANRQAAAMIKNPMNFLDGSGGFTRGLAREAGLALFMFTREDGTALKA